MKRGAKVLLNIIIMLLGVALIYGTIIYAKKNITNSSTSDIPTATGNDMPIGTNMDVPAKPTGNDISTNMGEPPEKPTGNDMDINMGEPPEKPTGNDMATNGMPMGTNMDEPSAKPGEAISSADLSITSTFTLSYKYVLVIIAGSLILMIGLTNLIMSGFGKHKIFINKDKIVIYILLLLIFTDLVASFTIYFFNTYYSNNDLVMSSEVTDNPALGAYKVEDTKEEQNKTYASTTSNENSILVTNGGNLTIDNGTITKTGDSTNIENSEFLGINAGILVQTNSIATIKNSSISTSAKGSNGIFSTGDNSKIYVLNTKINTSSNSSRGLDSTYGGYIEADNVTINTKGGSCATLATDRGDGTVIAKNSNLTTEGKGSPIIYSTGDISLINSTGTAKGSQAVVIEGKNSATLTNTKINTFGYGNRNNVDNAGVMIYQSMSGDASTGTGTLNLKDSTISIDESSSIYKDAPMFFITNTNAVINLTNSVLNFGSDNLISIAGTSEWGTLGKNGGTLVLNAYNQKMEGNIVGDNLSEVTVELNNSIFTSTINISNTLKSISLKIDSSSIWNVTGKSYVTKLELDNNDLNLINDNGYDIYYSKENNSWLNNGEIKLRNGGTLRPY